MRLQWLPSVWVCTCFCKVNIGPLSDVGASKQVSIGSDVGQSLVDFHIWECSCSWLPWQHQVKKVLWNSLCDDAYVFTCAAPLWHLNVWTWLVCIWDTFKVWRYFFHWFLLLNQSWRCIWHLAVDAEAPRSICGCNCVYFQGLSLLCVCLLLFLIVIKVIFSNFPFVKHFVNLALKTFLN